MTNHAVSSPTPTLWIGRVSRPGEDRQRTVLVRTDGRAPRPDDVVEEIADPFAAALPSAGGDAPGDALVLAQQAEPLPQGLRAPLGELVGRPPLRPGKIVCVGRNYAAHAREMGNEIPSEPLLFFKPSSALLAAGAPIDLPRGYERIDMEAELVVVIGRAGYRLAREQALDVVAGYTIGNDVSCRDLQKKDGQWARAKGFDGFAPLGPFVRLHATGAPLAGDIRIRGSVDGVVRQEAPLSDMIFDVATILAHVSACMTLEPGDIVFTGTPEGVYPLQPGGTTTVTTVGFDLGELVTPLR